MKTITIKALFGFAIFFVMLSHVLVPHFTSGTDWVFAAVGAAIGLAIVVDEHLTHSPHVGVISAFNNTNGVVRGFMDATDFVYELGAAAGGNKIYPSVKDLKENSKCWQECGIVEVEVRGVRVVEIGTEPGSPKVAG